MFCNVRVSPLTPPVPVLYHSQGIRLPSRSLTSGHSSLLGSYLGSLGSLGGRVSPRRSDSLRSSSPTTQVPVLKVFLPRRARRSQRLARLTSDSFPAVSSGWTPSELFLCPSRRSPSSDRGDPGPPRAYLFCPGHTSHGGRPDGRDYGTRSFSHGVRSDL